MATWITIGSRTVNLEQVTVVKMTGEGEGAEMLISFTMGWLKLNGPRAVKLHDELTGLLAPRLLKEGMGVELTGVADVAK